MNLSAIVALCNTALALLLLSGAGWAVFVLDRSAWWFAAALLAYVLLHLTEETTETGK